MCPKLFSIFIADHSMTSVHCPMKLTGSQIVRKCHTFSNKETQKLVKNVASRVFYALTTTNDGSWPFCCNYTDYSVHNVGWFIKIKKNKSLAMNQMHFDFKVRVRI